MKKLVVLNSFAVWLILSVALILFSGPAQAYVYDAFTSAGINTSLWVEGGANPGNFSQPGDGSLHFSETTGNVRNHLRSSNPVSGAFFVSMQYFNFYAENTQPPYHSTLVQLMLTDWTNFMIVAEGKNDGRTFFDAYSFNINPLPDGTMTDLAWVDTSATSGWLGLSYNGILGSGGRVTFSYNNGTGWTNLATCVPNFSSDPYFMIMGYDLEGTALSFQVDQVQVVPLPPSVLLLGSGLLGLVGWRRYRKN